MNVEEWGDSSEILFVLPPLPRMSPLFLSPEESVYLGGKGVNVREDDRFALN